MVAGTLSACWYGLIVASIKFIGIPVRTNHALRHVAPTRMAAAGLPPNLIQGQTGHKSERSLRPYLDSSPAERHKIAAAIGMTENHLYLSAQHRKSVRSRKK